MIVHLENWEKKLKHLQLDGCTNVCIFIYNTCILFIVVKTKTVWFPFLHLYSSRPLLGGALSLYLSQTLKSRWLFRARWPWRLVRVLGQTFSCVVPVPFWISKKTRVETSLVEENTRWQTNTGCIRWIWPKMRIFSTTCQKPRYRGYRIRRAQSKLPCVRILWRIQTGRQLKSRCCPL